MDYAYRFGALKQISHTFWIISEATCIKFVFR